jgi:hypothetical protein
VRDKLKATVVPGRAEPEESTKDPVCPYAAGKNRMPPKKSGMTRRNPVITPFRDNGFQCVEGTAKLSIVNVLTAECVRELSAELTILVRFCWFKVILRGWNDS